MINSTKVNRRISAKIFPTIVAISLLLILVSNAVDSPILFKDAYAIEEFDIDVDIEDNEIKRGDTQHMTVTVFNADTDKRVSDADVKLTVYPPESDSTSAEDETDDDGEATFDVKIDDNAETGNYDVDVRASKDGYDTKTTSTSFDVVGSSDDNDDDDDNYDGYDDDGHSGSSSSSAAAAASSSNNDDSSSAASSASSSNNDDDDGNGSSSSSSSSSSSLRLQLWEMPLQQLQRHQVHHQPQLLQEATQQRLLQLQEMTLLQQQLQLYLRMEDPHQQQLQQLTQQPHPQQHLQVTMKRMTMGAIRLRQRLPLVKTRTANSHKILQIFFLYTFC